MEWKVGCLWMGVLKISEKFENRNPRTELKSKDENKKMKTKKGLCNDFVSRK